MRKPTIVVVDDDPDMGKAFSVVLNARGYEAHVVSRPGEGGDFLKDSPVRVVLVDLKHPDLAGPETLDRIQDAYPLSEVIILTGYATLDWAISATEKWAFSYILKPYEIDQLLLHVRQAVEKQVTAARFRQCRERLEARVQELTKELKLAREAVEAEFMANIRQGLRTPLSIITACSTILADDLNGELNEKQRKYAEYILSTGKALQNIVMCSKEYSEAKWKDGAFISISKKKGDTTAGPKDTAWPLVAKQ